MTNSCKYYLELISESVDGVLDDKLEEELSAHLNSCSDCRLRMEIFKLAHSEDFLTDPPDNFTENIMLMVAENSSLSRDCSVPSKKRRFSFWRYGAAVAAAAVLAVTFLGGRINLFKSAVYENQAATGGGAIVAPAAPPAAESVPSANLFLSPSISGETGDSAQTEDIFESYTVPHGGFDAVAESVSPEAPANPAPAPISEPYDGGLAEDSGRIAPSGALTGEVEGGASSEQSAEFPPSESIYGSVTVTNPFDIPVSAVYYTSAPPPEALTSCRSVTNDDGSLSILVPISVFDSVSNTGIFILLEARQTDSAPVSGNTEHVLVVVTP